MKSGLPDAPVLKSLPYTLDAAQYNRTRLALVRLGCPQQLVLGLRGLVVRLDRDTWVCADRKLDDLPLVAWTGFDTRHRAGLHAPVHCDAIYYHAYARVVAATVLQEVDRRLEGLLALAPRPSRRGPKVLTLSDHKN